jgi:hypothetical protein
VLIVSTTSVLASSEFFPAFNFSWGEAHERFKRLRVFHAQPFSSFSRIYLVNLCLGLTYFTEEKSELAKSINFKEIFLSIFLIFS